MRLLLALAGACSSPPPPALPLGTGPAVENGQLAEVEWFLAPTALGAKDNLLCPWFRGESVPDASLARWKAEARLDWLVLSVGAGRDATLAGSPDLAARAREALDASAALATRCGAARPVRVVVAAAADLPADALLVPLGRLAEVGIDRAWLPVEDATPAIHGGTSSGPPSPVVVSRNAGRYYLFDASGGFWRGDAAPADADDPPPPADPATEAARLARFVAETQTTCAVVAAEPDAGLTETLRFVDAVLAAGPAYVALSTLGESHRVGAPPAAAGAATSEGGAAPVAVPGPGPSLPLHASLSSVVLELPVRGGPCDRSGRRGAALP